jgi:adenine-specific DNA methylase/ssDNA-binding Zn-finger/Zn-ribbon topoisomerase 1
MMSNGKNDLFGMEPTPADENSARKKARKNLPAPRTSRQAGTNGYEPPNLGKAIRLPVPDFSDPDRPPVCLEVDFPIAPINALSNLEGNAGKPIYQMSKWWARRRSSVFRSLLIAAATEAPGDTSQAAKRVWDHYYCNHQKAGAFRKLRVLDIFMGGGTTLVEGARLGFQMAGVDLNPVAWFVTKNELACSDPGQVKALFEDIEANVKPLVQPFYTTTCPRGHTGRWVDRENGKVVDIDPAEIPPDQRTRFLWEGPEIIYTFWAKHGPCNARGCNHRTPIFRSPVIAEKKLTAYFIPATCPSCGHEFNIELGETRMAPGVERAVLENEPSFTETSQEFAQLIKDYSKGNKEEKQERIDQSLGMLDAEAGLRCPKCSSFAGGKIKRVLEEHRGRRLQMENLAAYEFKVGNVKKKDLGIESRHVYMYLLIHPKWMEGASGLDDGEELGGFADADPEMTARWFERRLEGMRFVEVRGRIRLADEEITEEDEEEAGENEDAAEEEDAESAADRKKFGLPREIVLADGTRIQTRTGTVPQQSHFTCQKCGKKQDILESVKPTKHTAPVAAYALQCHCPQCDSNGYNYNGRYFKPLEPGDVKRLILAEREWADRNETDLNDYWPRSELLPAYMTHKLNGGIPNWGYTHWWKMFNPRQLLVHAQLMRAISEAPEDEWPLDVREQALGAFQQYLRNQNMFCFYQHLRDHIIPHMSNANYYPKGQPCENNVFHKIGQGNWSSSSAKIIQGLIWANEPWEAVLPPETGKSKSIRCNTSDPVISGSDILCGSSTDLSILNGTSYDLVITDPPFGNNLFYADLADFFYVWMRLPLLKWYRGMPERKHFEPERTPHAVEAVGNTVEHPDDREDYERERFVTNGMLATVRELTGNKELGEKDPNPLYRPEPASDFYQKTLTACWAEAGRLLKQGGLMAFTFHHSADAPWVDVLEALFNAGYLLVATYPVRSDETRGERASFGSRKIEYDIVHVCRKRLEEPKAVSWARMRRWVKDEAAQLKELLEHSHGKELPESDLTIILIGKGLEFYSRHYGQVYTGEGQQLSVGNALLGVKLLLEDLSVDTSENGKHRPPDAAEPASRLFLHVFQGRRSMARDELHKTLRGTGVSQGDIEARGWIRVVGTSVNVIPIEERFQYFTAPGRNRKVLKTDLDQAHFLIGAATPRSGVDVSEELNRDTFQIKRSVDPILDWYSQTDPDTGIQQAAKLALDLVTHWRAKPKRPEKEPIQMTLFEKLEAEANL